MQQAATYLLGEQDFSSFQSSQCQSSTPMRRIDNIKVRRDGYFVVIDITANAFLHHMVRNIVGTLLMIGQGRYHTDWINRVLMAKDRKVAGMTAPAQGLYFVSASYPDHFGLPLQVAPERLTQISDD
jgi:tRNA pseudouridine38-40 synthase